MEQGLQKLNADQRLAVWTQRMYTASVDEVQAILSCSGDATLKLTA